MLLSLQAGIATKRSNAERIFAMSQSTSSRKQGQMRALSSGQGDTPTEPENQQSVHFGKAVQRGLAAVDAPARGLRRRVCQAMGR
jgi:hypothetical protein